MNDLSNLSLLKFHAVDSDYGNCLDISSEGFLSIGGDEELPDIAARIGDFIKYKVMRWQPPQDF